MNAVALRTERALVDWLIGEDWSDSPTGIPNIVTSYGHGAFDDPDLEDQMPSFPRIIVRTTSCVPVHVTERSCEIEVTITLEISADDTNESHLLGTVQVFDNILQSLFIDNNISDLDADDLNPSGPFTAMFAAPTDFGINDINERARTFPRTMTIYAAANTQP